MRWSYLFWLVVVAGAATTLFEIKHEVQSLEEQLLRAQHKIRQERETIEVLRAEWSYLNQPARIESLAKEYLGLQPLGPDQIVSVDRLPPRPEDFDRVPVAVGSRLPPAKPEVLPQAPTQAQTPALPRAMASGRGQAGAGLAITPVSETTR